MFFETVETYVKIRQLSFVDDFSTIARGETPGIAIELSMKDHKITLD